jgi:hypothetical protein
MRDRPKRRSVFSLCIARSSSPRSRSMKRKINTSNVNGNGYAPPALPVTFYCLTMNITQQQSTEYLSTELDKAESARRDLEGLRDGLEWVRPPSLRLLGRRLMLT